MSTNYLMEKEVQEAISAGERALSCLQEAAKELEKARNWGMVDIFGGGLLISIIKHAKINNASSRMDAARNALRVFEKELKDVVMYQELHMEIGDFLTFADFFFDNFLVDFMVQSKITEAARQVDQAIGKVEQLLLQLRNIGW